MAISRSSFAAYGQRLQLDRLRQEFYDETDPERAEALLQKLLRAEEEAGDLVRIEEHTGVRGVLSSRHMGETPPPSEYGTPMGPETTGIAATVLLRMSHVPTGIIHLFEPPARPLVTYRLRYGRDRAQAARRGPRRGVFGPGRRDGGVAPAARGAAGRVAR
jgi:hypothetical protein